jgi:hypothetical protein
VPFFVPRDYAVPAVLVIWACATFPQIIVNVGFSVVMNAVAGPQRRYDLMTRRWSILGLTTAITVAMVGQLLELLDFPLNYQVVFMALSAGGLISLYFSSHIDLPDAVPPPPTTGRSWSERFRGYVNLVRGEPDFVAFTTKRFVYHTGWLLAAPLIPLYLVRDVQANDAWIGMISTTQTAIVLIGYPLWSRQSRTRGSRFVLLCTILGMSFHPVLTALTHQVEWIALFAGLMGICQAGIDLVFFDELMKTVPPEYSATFVSIAQSAQYVPTIVAPLLGTLLADQIGLGGALIVSGLVRLIAFGLFALPGKAPAVKTQEFQQYGALGK